MPISGISGGSTIINLTPDIGISAGDITDVTGRPTSSYMEAVKGSWTRSVTSSWGDEWHTATMEDDVIYLHHGSCTGDNKVNLVVKKLGASRQWKTRKKLSPHGEGQQLWGCRYGHQQGEFGVQLWSTHLDHNSQ